MALDAEQLMNAGAIVKAGREVGADDQAIAAAIATALMESGLRNVDHGDRDSLGLFQQRANWGSAAERMDPDAAARKFFAAYSGAKGSTVLEKIANTQRPEADLRGRYADHFSDAEAAFQQVTGQAPPALSGAPTKAKDTTLTAAAAPPAAKPDEPLAPNAPPDQIEAYIQQHNPELIPFLRNPEIKMIAYFAATHPVSQRQVDSMVEQSNYWQTHSSTSQAFDKLIAEQPTDAGQTVDRAKAALNDVLSQNGIHVDDVTLGNLAKQQIRAGNINLSGDIARPDAINDLVASKVTPGIGTGNVTASANSIKNLARADYLIPLTDTQAQMYATAVLNGTMTNDGVKDALRQQAAERYPWLKPNLDASPSGTTASVTGGLQATIANELELDPATVDLLDPKYNRVLEMTDKNGVTRSMTTGEAAQWARQQPGYANTQAYGQHSASFAHGLSDFINGKAA